MGPATIAIERVYVGRPAPIALDAINLAGDDQADRTVHGGADKAVYVHPSEHLPRWAVELGQPRLSEPPFDVAPFGENVSTRGVTEATACIGDVWTWGTARLQICQPRWPCHKLALHRASADIGSRMRSSGRTGWYLRVLEPGVVPAGGSITVAERHAAGVTVADANQAMLDRSVADRDLVGRVAGLVDVLAAEWRRPLQERLGIIT